MNQRLDVYHLPDKTLTVKDNDMLRTFKTLTGLDRLLEFSSDDFRLYGLDRFIVDKAHGIGGFFAKLKANGLIVEVRWKRSSVPTNHGRRIPVWRWKE